MANQDLVFDISKVHLEQINQQLIIGRVGDGGLKAVTVSVMSNGTPYDLTGKTVSFEGLKPDGTHIIDANGGIVLNAQGGIFRYVFPYQAFTAMGEYEQAFFKVSRDSQTDTTLEFKIKVLENKVEMGINSVSFISDFENLNAQLKQAYDDFLERIKSDQETTQNIIESTKTTIQSLQEQLNTLNTKIQNSDIVTSGQYENDMKTLNDQIGQFTSAVDNLGKSVSADLGEMKQKVDTAIVDKMDKTPVVLADIHDIISTGVYWYNSTTQNLPPKLNGDHTNGFIFAVFSDQDNGLVSMQGSDWHIEKYQGAFRNWVPKSPVLLFSGSAKAGDTIKLAADISAFSYFLFEIHFKTDYYHVSTQRRVPVNKVFYINNAGLKSNGKGMYQDEIRLKYTDGKTLVVTECLSLDTEKMEISNPDIYISSIKGVF
ncbi:phage baseplate upper protein [Bacillus atrophaeus]|uniref:phage baseplate upper protein n=1 Tax=Bacillus atrophaeus TaxID=1452 RepID=UPI00227ECB6A|nr:BppU family phage baseplate upper protein [Bacillus atrophaeus]MCY8842474.1 BppU family phage baseplate upper protein [Bacillus atrophaeus]MEC0804684.1 BppU family phage baseplate upper protein [Bacillus atrophaeus]MEC0852601.1 BppU family phage baseplate upper protein [Bacillus atrophaeus]MEC0859513.1 BppU family phage baseplate upper protein [Bacillus atrophaeus]MEC0862320.1 BppU family phage baseplate upper protein [Bacillus atrophaeus]